MAFYTKPINLLKGQDNIASLDKSQLLLESKVSSDSYYSDSSNWNYVVVSYKSTSGNQRTNVIFDASEISPSAPFFITEKAKDVWEVQSVRIDDFDGGYLSFDRSELTVSDFDLSFLPPEPTQLAITQQFSNVLAGDVISPSLTIEIRDIDNNIVTSATNEVTLNLITDPSSGTAVISGTLTKNAVNGIVSFDNISIDKAFDGYVFEATSLDLTSVVANAINISPNVAAQLSYVTQPPSQLNEELIISPSIEVEILDAFGNRTADTSTISLAFGNDPTGASNLLGTVSKSAVAGLATFDDIIIDLTTGGGTQSGFTLTSSSSGLTSTTSSSFDVYQLSALAGSVSNTLAGDVIPSFNVTVVNSTLATVTDFTGQVKIQIGTDPSGGSAVLSGTLTKNAVNGIVTFDDLSINEAFDGYTLEVLRETPSGFQIEAVTNSFNIESLVVPVNLNRDFSSPNFLESNELLSDDIANGSSLIYGTNQLEYSLSGTGSLAFAKYRRDFTPDGQNIEQGAQYIVEIDINSFTSENLEAGDRILINLAGNSATILFSNIVNGSNTPISFITATNLLSNRVDLDFSPQSGTIGKEVSFNISAIRVTKV